jgi:transposase-like protein
MSPDYFVRQRKSEPQPFFLCHILGIKNTLDLLSAHLASRIGYGNNYMFFVFGSDGKPNGACPPESKPVATERCLFAEFNNSRASMGKKVKKHSSEFKFKVVLESYLKDNVAEVSRQYGINANQLSLWREQFISQGYQAFEGDAAKGDAKFRKKVEQLENLIGKKEVEISILKNYLDFYVPLDGK